MIIEDIFKKYRESDYINRLSDILHEFQDYYFVSLDHKNRVSTNWDNDKLFILVKGGAQPIFRSKHKITIITPSCRPNNLPSLKKSINFDYVDEWIIVYDGSKIKECPNIFKDDNNPKIKEYIIDGPGISGNPQRNYGLDMVSNENTYLYFLDDDNTIHPNLYKLLNIVDDSKFYSFNQYRENYSFIGNNISVNAIDTAMVLIDYSKCKDIRWITNLYEADGHYIVNCYSRFENSRIFIDNILSNYNMLR
jgi:hypothetical protein